MQTDNQVRPSLKIKNVIFFDIPAKKNMFSFGKIGFSSPGGTVNARIPISEDFSWAFTSMD